MKSVAEFEGLEIGGEGKDRDATLNLINHALSLASEISTDTKLHKSLQLSAALTNSLLTVSSLLNKASAKCTIESPPEDIDVRTDADGNLVMRCYHNPYHEWDKDGNLK